MENKYFISIALISINKNLTQTAVLNIHFIRLYTFYNICFQLKLPAECITIVATHYFFVTNASAWVRHSSKLWGNHVITNPDFQTNNISHLVNVNNACN